MAEHNEEGKWGEEIASNFLASKGYAIVERNWRMQHLEIDIVASKGSRIVFVEVKTRSSGYVDPLKSIDRRRQSHLIAAADVYVRAKNMRQEVQFDILNIIGKKDSPTAPVIEHFPDAFIPSLSNSRRLKNI